ncbi:MAG TPA: PhzF family phenazine biosynthesis protein [Thermoanaerobaculia bacterium]|jgi:PhzF family phenazine biosynthesis protein|nr:PhzF family phenazine biosynthesis protein [Thermoanaerobaculia bacterium]
MPFDLYHVDAFTDRAFAGNPAAVCLLLEPRDAAWMQDVAREMNLSATAFLDPAAEGFNLRWFTPAMEIDLCGHGTLAAAHVLAETGRLASGDMARFHTKSGLLTAVSQGGWIELDFPARPVVAAAPLAGLAEAFGAAATLFTGTSGETHLLELPSEAAVRAATPDFPRLTQLKVRRVILTARAEAGPFDIVSRYFAPGMGLHEDPVTGSAHCVLGPYWTAKLGKPELLAYQASARGGSLKVRVEGDRVKLGGQAVTVLHGRLLAG